MIDHAEYQKDFTDDKWCAAVQGNCFFVKLWEEVNRGSIQDMDAEEKQSTQTGQAVEDKT